MLNVLGMQEHQQSEPLNVAPTGAPEPDQTVHSSRAHIASDALKFFHMFCPVTKFREEQSREAVGDFSRVRSGTLSELGSHSHKIFETLVFLPELVTELFACASHLASRIVRHNVRAKCAGSLPPPDICLVTNVGVFTEVGPQMKGACWYRRM